MASATIVIPTYNRAWGLERALQSALDQSHSDLEVVVSDDCSSDDTEDVVARFRDDRLVYYREPRNVGMVRNWGKGLELARGTYVVFLGDDDSLGSDFVANRVRIAERFRATVVFSGYEVRAVDGSVVGIRNDGLGAARVLESHQLLEAALSRRWFVGSSLYRRDACLAIWPQIEADDLVLDLALNVRLALEHGVSGAYTPSADFRMLAHAGQNSNAKRSEVFDQTSLLLERIWQQLRGDSRAALVRKELASWHTVWARSLADDGELRQARSHLVHAIRTAPELAWPWRQFLRSVLQPSRFVASARTRVDR